MGQCTSQQLPPPPIEQRPIKKQKQNGALVSLHNKLKTKDRVVREGFKKNGGYKKPKEPQVETYGQTTEQENNLQNRRRSNKKKELIDIIQRNNRQRNDITDMGIFNSKPIITELVESPSVRRASRILRQESRKQDDFVRKVPRNINGKCDVTNTAAADNGNNNAEITTTCNEKLYIYETTTKEQLPLADKNIHIVNITSSNDVRKASDGDLQVTKRSTDQDIIDADVINICADNEKIDENKQLKNSSPVPESDELHYEDVIEEIVYITVEERLSEKYEQEPSGPQYVIIKEEEEEQQQQQLPTTIENRLSAVDKHSPPSTEEQQTPKTEDSKITDTKEKIPVMVEFSTAVVENDEVKESMSALNAVNKELSNDTEESKLILEKQQSEKILKNKFEEKTSSTKDINNESKLSIANQNIESFEFEISEFAREFTASILQKIVLEADTEDWKRDRITEQTRKSNELINESITHEQKPKPFVVSKYRQFVLQKYAEKVADKMMLDILPAKPIFSPNGESKSLTDYTAQLTNTILQSVLLEQTSITGDESSQNLLNKIAANIAERVLTESIADLELEVSSNSEIVRDRKYSTEKDNITQNTTTRNIPDLEIDETDSAEQLLGGSRDIEQRPHAPTLTIIQDQNEVKLIVADVEINTDRNHNNILEENSYQEKKKISDRPLSGYAEKLALLLAEEDDIEFDSDEELNESIQKIQTDFSPGRCVSIEIKNFQDQCNKTEIDDNKSKEFQSKARRRKNDNKFGKGDRPKSLYTQDMLDDFLNEVDDEVEFNEEDDNAEAKLIHTKINGYVDREGSPYSEDSAHFDDSDESEEEYDDEDEDDEDVLEDEIQPVSETVVLLENQIPLLSGKSVSPTYDYEEVEVIIEEDGFMRSHSSNLNNCLPSGDKPVDLKKAAVIDIGCGVLKAGLCGEVRPSCYCPSVIGVPRRFSQDISKMKKAYYVGDEAWTVAGMLQIEHPIKQNVSNWSDVTNIIENLLEEQLSVNDSEHPILMTEMSLCSRKHREKITEIMFERFNVPSFYLANQSCLAMYSKGLVSGVSLNSGFYHTHATPIYEGHAIPHATMQLDIGGDHVTSYLGRRIMSTQGTLFNSSSEKLVLNSMKQSLCYVAEDTLLEADKYKNNSDMYQMFTLPDGQEIELGTERFIAPEILFDPNMLGLQQPSVVEMVPRSIDLVDLELQKLFSQNVLISGGNSKLKGFGNRLEKEIVNLPTDTSFTLKYADDPILSTWIGASILASIEGYRDQWISMTEYVERGPGMVHTLCF